MKPTIKTLTERTFDRMVDVLLEEFGEDWIKNTTANHHFQVGTVSLLQDADGVHLIGEPENEHNAQNFNLWVDFPVEDLLAADELAFSLFAHLSEDIFVATRVFEDRGVRYKFITGTEEDGHLGSLNLTGTHAIEFVTFHRMRMARGLQFSA